MQKGGPATEGPLKEARDEMKKLKEKITEAQKSMSEIRKKAEEAKRGYTQKEAAEKNAHIEARNQKEAAPFLEGPKAKFAALEAASKTCDEAAAPMIDLKGDDLKVFATPASVSEAVAAA